MQTPVKISALQMALLSYSAIAVTAILYLPASSYNYAGRDFWITPFASALFGIATIFAVIKLHRYYPEETLIQYSIHIFGKIPGKIWGTVFLLFMFIVAIQATWQYAEFVSAYFLPKTPRTVILGMMALISAYAVRQGLEVIARIAQILTPLILAVFIFVFLLLLPDADTNHIFPIMENGILPIIKGSYPANLWYSEFVTLAFLLPYLSENEKRWKWSFISLGLVVGTMVFMYIIALLSLGGTTGSLNAPLINAIQYINIGNFLTHIEVLVLAFWIAGAFIKMNLLFYVITKGSAQLLELSDERPIVFPVLFLNVIVASWFVPTFSAYEVYLKTIGAILGPFFFTAAPLVLLLIAVIKRKGAAGT